MKKINQLINVTTNFVIVLLLLACVASYRGKLFGIKNNDLFREKAIEKTDIFVEKYPFLKEEGWVFNKKGIWQKFNQSKKLLKTVVFSEQYAKDIYGYGGPIALLIYLDQEDRITKIEVGENYETPVFLDNVLKSGFFKQFVNISIKEFDSASCDVVTGATVSSSALIKTVEKTAAAYQGVNIVERIKGNIWENYLLSNLFPLATVMFALLLFLFFKGNKVFRIIQLIMNVIVLGGLFGSMLSIQLFLNMLNNGISLSTSLVPVSIIIVIMLLNIFNKKNFYCMWVCPFGSAQELLGKLTKINISFSNKYQKILNNLRNSLLLLLLFISWVSGITYIYDYEPFTVFLLQQAATPVLVIASVSLFLSVFIKRCWCRFFCPTGAILNFIQTTNK